MLSPDSNLRFDECEEGCYRFEWGGCPAERGHGMTGARFSSDEPTDRRCLQR